MPAKTMTATSRLQQHTPSHDRVRTTFFNVITSDTSGSGGSGGKTNTTPTTLTGSKQQLLVQQEQQHQQSCITDVKKWDFPLQIPLIQMLEKTKESLKYDKLEDRRYSPKRSRSDSEESNKCQRKRRKQISFDEAVEVVPIPTKDAYEGPVREKMWASVDEIHLNAARNTVEFISEGWNWRTVMEDEGMYHCVVTGERIHPIHYANLGIKPGEFVP